MTIQPRRRWFRFAFSLRTLFVLVTIFGVWLGWQLKIVRERKAVLAEVQLLDPRNFRYRWIDQNEKHATYSVNQFGLTRYEYPAIPFVRRVFGDKNCASLELPTSIETARANRVEIAFPEAELFVYGFREGEFFQYRDSLYRPADERQPNRGTLFKTGLIEK